MEISLSFSVCTVLTNMLTFSSFLGCLMAVMMVVSAQEDPCYRENTNCHRWLRNGIEWNSLIRDLVSFNSPEICLLTDASHEFREEEMTWKWQQSNLWFSRPGVNDLGTIPYFPDIWACELACRDTAGCNWFTWWHVPLSLDPLTLSLEVREPRLLQLLPPHLLQQSCRRRESRLREGVGVQPRHHSDGPPNLDPTPGEREELELKYSSWECSVQ